MTRRILHVDMDQFFAAVEQRDRPELRGKPVAVGHDAPRGVVSTASYEARRYGVHSAQAIMTAKRLCPNLIIVEPRFQAYKEASTQIRQIFQEYTDLIEPLSLDEAFLDVTENKRGLKLGVDCAREIKQRIWEETHLTASAGVSYCKFLAKIASDYRKPDGLCTIHPTQALAFIASLPVEKFWGVGPVTAKRMHTLGISTGDQLRARPKEWLMREFGKMGAVYYDFARGIDNRPVEAVWIRKSIGTERTLEEDISEKNQVDGVLHAVAVELVERLQRHPFRGLTLTLKVKFYDFTQITRSHTQEQPFMTLEDILPVAQQLMDGVEYTANPIRLMGLTVSNSIDAIHQHHGDAYQLELDFKDW